MPRMKLSELVSFKTGKLDSNASIPDGDYPFFTCSQETLRTNTYSFDCECVVLAGNNANGIYPLKYFQGKFDAYQRTYVVRTRDSEVLDTKFLYYALRPKLSELRSLSTGAATKFLTLTILNSVEIDVPILTLQRRIAAILFAYDDLIENCERRIRVLDEMARALYREWFVLFRYPGHGKTPLVESPLGQIPKGWATGSFTDFVDVLSGGTPKTDVAEFWNGEIPFFTPRDAPDCFYVRDTEKHISPLGLSRCASELYPPDTVFITARGTVGKVALPSVPMAMNQSCYALRARGDMSQRFLFLLTLQQVDYLKKNTGGATFATIVVDTFRRMQVVLPPAALIAEFTRLVEPMFDTIRSLDSRLANLRTTRDLLLPRLLSGQLSVEEAA